MRVANLFVCLSVVFYLISCGGLKGKIETTVLTSTANQTCPIVNDPTPAPTTPVVVPTPPQFVAISYGRANSFNSDGILSIPKPAGVIDGDLLIMMIGSDNAADWNNPAGWTLLYDDHYPTADGANFNTYYRIASAEPVSYDITAIPYTASAAGWIAAWHGVNPTMPFISQAHNTYYQKDAVATKTLTVNSIVTNVDNSKIVFIGYVDQNTTAPMTFAVPAGYTMQGSQQDGNNWVTSVIGEYTLTSQGSTGAQSVNWSNGILNSDVTSGVGAILLALRPL